MLESKLKKKKIQPFSLIFFPCFSLRSYSLIVHFSRVISFSYFSHGIFSFHFIVIYLWGIIFENNALNGLKVRAKGKRETNVFPTLPYFICIIDWCIAPEVVLSYLGCMIQKEIQFIIETSGRKICYSPPMYVTTFKSC